MNKTINFVAWFLALNLWLAVTGDVFVSLVGSLLGCSVGWFIAHKYFKGGV